MNGTFKIMIQVPKLSSIELSSLSRVPLYLSNERCLIMSQAISLNSITLGVSLHDLSVMTSLFQNVCHENVIWVIQFQELHFMLDYVIKCSWCAFTNIFQNLSENMAQKWEKWYLLLSGKRTPNSRKDGKVGLDLVDSMLIRSEPRKNGNIIYFYMKTLLYQVRPKY